MILLFILSACVGYFLGSIPFGLFVGKAKGVDIRQHGSGNIGATNVSRTLGKKWGILVFLLDMLKGLAAVLLVKLIYSSFFGGATGDEARAYSEELVAVGVPVYLGIVAAVFCILGHNFPVWLGFKGGKGVATSAGVLLGLMPIAGVVSFLVWLLFFYTTRYVSVASIIAAVSIPITVWVTERSFGGLFWFALVVAGLAIWRHRPNIQRLLAGTENRFEKKKS
jgi:glycerol-3-phosphate acyltransferase PlsY